MTAIYDDVKKLYNILADEHGNLDDIKATLKHLKKHHKVDKKFIETTLKAYAIERMVLAVMESLDKDAG